MISDTRVDDFTEFVRVNEQRLRHALIASCGPQAGRDATSDAFVYAWEHWDRIADLDNAVGYLYTVARNRTRRSLSRLRRRPLFEGAATAGIPDIEPGLPAALDALSDRQRTVVVLVHCYQWTLAEVAEVTGLSKSTVQNHLERGMEKLRQRIGGHS